ncbi:MAG: ATP-binding cassette domain-containing protein [Candidatus Micrarchaeota archaeon]|nr:ATP-binding cassette domain-containing protein [Candidatus Micrarchaeota archaeon]
MEAAVSIRRLSKKYGDFLALDNINLGVEEGKLFAILGPNGAGKTTLLRILTTQFEPTAGEAFVLGKNVVSQSEELRKLISYVPQEMSVWTDISGYENLLIYSKIYGLPAATRKDSIKDSMELMDLSDVANNLVSTYSGGMIRKLELACAVMIKPKILFLDEPTIGLDPATRKTIWEKLKALNRESGMDVFFSTHYMDEADNYADEIGIINHGKLIKVASPYELKRSVGYDRIEIETDSEPSKHALADLKRLNGVKKVELEGNEVTISAKDSAALLDVIIECLLANKVHVRKISARQPTIDDVFLKYAGAKESKKAPVQLADVKKFRDRIRRG